MDRLIEARNTIRFLQEHGISAKKRYGQNFLIDPRILDRIIGGAGICREDAVLEIGPGLGTLTQALCASAGHVTAVEIDREMIPLLEENLSGCDNYEIVNADVLKTDLKELMKEPLAAGMTLKAVANLPYYITTPVIMALLESGLRLRSITVMVQKEVADRMQAAPGTPDYGALSLAVQYRAEVSILSRVPSNCFIPRPNVDSSVVHLALYDTPPVAVTDEKAFFRLIRAAFAQRRKTLANAVKNEGSFGVSREEVEAALTGLGLPADIRGERLSLEQFAALTERLH